MEIKRNYQKKNINILSLDGGGIRGVLTAEILVKVEEHLKEIYKDNNFKIADHFDYIAGTSTGGILAAIYTVPNDNNKSKFSAEDASELYQKEGDLIFKKDFQFFKSIFGLFGSKYSSKNLKKLLTKYFGDSKISDSTKHLFLTSVDIERRRLNLFKSYKNKNKDTFVDAVMSTTCAPTYFIPYLFVRNKMRKVLIDGGMAINNPSISAYIECLDLYPNEKNINIMSIGTGALEKPIAYKKAKRWGIIRWIKPLIDMILVNMSEAVDYQLKMLYKKKLNGEYLRIDPRLKRASHKIDKANKENLLLLKRDGVDSALEYQTKIIDFIKNSKK